MPKRWPENIDPLSWHTRNGPQLYQNPDKNILCLIKINSYFICNTSLSSVTEWAALRIPHTRGFSTRHACNRGTIISCNLHLNISSLKRKIHLLKVIQSKKSPRFLPSSNLHFSEKSIREGCWHISHDLGHSKSGGESTAGTRHPSSRWTPHSWKVGQ